MLTLGVANPDLTDVPPAAQAEAKRLESVLDKLSQRMRQSVEIAQAKGVFIGAGSDAGGNPPRSAQLQHGQGARAAG